MRCATASSAPPTATCCCPRTSPSAWGDQSRLQDVTEGYPTDWTMEQLRDTAQHIADEIDEFIRVGVPAPADRAA